MTLPGALNDHDDLMRRIANDLVDSYDEEIELELEDRSLDELEGRHVTDRVERQAYFKELFRLQGELVKLQDWVQHTRKKVVILFEGRDAAGKGGVIKRITQRLNPRVVRVAALPAPNDRERTQWYFQCYTAHLPAAGVVEGDNKKRARLNCIQHLLSQVGYHEISHPRVQLPERVRHKDYIRRPVPGHMVIPNKY